jgi:hypothetical protein
MRSVLPTTILTLALIFSHSLTFAQKPTTALDLNNYLADITDSLFTGGREWGSAMVKAKETGNFSTLATSRKRLENFIERKRIDVVKMQDINGSEKLRLAMLDLLFIEAKMIKEAFLSFEKFNSQTTDADINKAIAYLQEKATDEAVFVNEVRKAQDAYARKNGFTIEEEE